MSRSHNVPVRYQGTPMCGYIAQPQQCSLVDHSITLMYAYVVKPLLRSTMKFVIVTLQRRALYTGTARRRKRTLPRLFNVPRHRHAVAMNPRPILDPAPSSCRHRVARMPICQFGQSAVEDERQRQRRREALVAHRQQHQFHAQSQRRRQFHLSHRQRTHHHDVRLGLPEHHESNMQTSTAT